MSKKGIVLISVGAKIYQTTYLNFLISIVDTYVTELDLVLLDKLERINEDGISNLYNSKISVKINSHVQQIKELVKPQETVKINWFSWDRFYGDNKGLSTISQEVFNIYRSNRKFKNHCQNQVYRNLHPILEKYNIKRRDKVSLDHLAEYLLHEISIKIYVNNLSIYVAEFSPHAEMDILTAIYDGKYPEFSDLIEGKSKLKCIKFSPL